MRVRFREEGSRSQRDYYPWKDDDNEEEEQQQQQIKQLQSEYDNLIPTNLLFDPRRRQTLQHVLKTLIVTSCTASTTSIAYAPCSYSSLANALEEDSTTTSLLQRCQDGALIPETQVTGAYEQICMTLPVRQFPITKTTTPTETTTKMLQIQQGTMTGASTTGMAVWNASILLSRLLTRLQNVEWSSIDWTTLSIAELGCGPGLASFTAAVLGSQHVLATDGNPQVVALAQKNIDINQLSSSVQTQTLPWGPLNAMDYAETYDIVMGSDLTYQSQNWPALAATMVTMVKPRTGVVLYLTLGHTGFAVQAEVQGFLAVAQQYGLVPLMVGPPSNGSGGNDNVNRRSLLGSLATVTINNTDMTRLLYEHCISPDEVSLIQATGGVRVLLLQRKL
jgi:ribosomal protein L11 methylase PrmA